MENEKMPFEFLGYDDHCHIFKKGKRIIKIYFGHFNEIAFMEIAPSVFWQQQFPSKKSPYYTLETAIDWIIRESEQVGRYNNE